MNKYPSGPNGLPVLGNALDFVDMFNTFRANGTTAPIVHYRVLHLHFYQLNDAALVDEALVSKIDYFKKADRERDALGPWVGKSVLYVEGKEHHERRHQLQPAFHHRMLETYLSIMQTKAEQFTQTWAQRGSLEAKSDLSALTLAIVSKALFGEDDIQHITDTVKASVRTMAHIAESEARIGSLPDWLPIQQKREKKQAIRVLDSVVREMIEKQRPMAETTSFLASLLNAGLSDQQIRDDAITLFAAGQETTAAMLSWVFYELAQRPELEAKLRAEAQQILDKGPLTYQRMSEFVEIDRVIKETLRMYPPVWLILRQVKTEVEVGGYRLAPGSFVLIDPFALHHNPRYFDDPETFNPDRWKDNFERGLPRGAYIPFNIGPHVCLGQQFALMAGKVILATVCASLHLNTDVRGAQPKPEGSVIPDRPIHINVDPLVRTPDAVHGVREEAI
jgi:cytochrome P450